MLTAARTLSTFSNEPIRTFRDPAEQLAMETAIARERGTLGRRYPLLIDGERIDGAQTIPSINPSDPGQIIGDVVAATLADASRALAAATRAFGSWSRTSFVERSALLVRAAAAIRERKDEFNALMVLEVGKTWIEADADTAEAIDFLEYYAREALRLASPAPLVPSPLPETNELRYLPLGVGAVIPPWNFVSSTTFRATARPLAKRSCWTRELASSRSPALRRLVCGSTSSPRGRNPASAG
jgi:1-pyrroline-5-carboxylate dehydrogenase